MQAADALKGKHEAEKRAKKLEESAAVLRDMFEQAKVNQALMRP